MNNYQRPAFIFATIVAMGGFVFGLDAALISGTIGFITREFGLSSLELGTVVSAPALGVLFALPVAGYASNLLGRRQTLQVIALLYVVSAIASTLAPNYWMLVIARFLGGLAFSSITLASMYIGEIAPAKWRGKLGSMIQINIVVGLSAAYFINYFILQAANADIEWLEALGISQHTWRWMLGAEILPAVLWLALLFFIPQSPYWLLYKGRVGDAEDTLRKLMPESAIPAKIEEIQLSLEESTEDRSIMTQLRAIFSRSNRIVFIVALTIAIAQQSTGINAILFYAPIVFEQIGLGTDGSFVQAIWIGLVSVAFTALSLMLIDKVGRRPMILWGMVWIISSLLVCSWAFNQARYQLTPASISELTEIPDAHRLQAIADIEYDSDLSFKKALIATIGEADAQKFSSPLIQKAASLNAMVILIGILSFVAAFQFSVGPIMWILFSEFFPISIRGIAIPFFAFITSLTSYLVQQFFPWQLANMGITAILIFYAITVAIGLVILYFYLPETKNLTIEEIQENMKAKVKAT